MYIFSSSSLFQGCFQLFRQISAFQANLSFSGKSQLFRQISALHYVQPDDVQAYEQDNEIIHSLENRDILILEPDIDYSC